MCANVKQVAYTIAAYSVRVAVLVMLLYSMAATKAKLPYGVANANRLYMAYKRYAKKRKREFSLTKDEFLTIIVGSCKYCARSLTQEYGQKTSNGLFRYTGIDRIDNAQGYTNTNSVACCKECNFMKRAMSHETFLEHIAMIHKVSFSK